MLVYLIPVTSNIIAQACCWYTCFNWCGCFEQEKEIIYTESPKVVVPANNNPFSNPGAPKDAHLQSAYL